MPLSIIRNRLERKLTTRYDTTPGKQTQRMQRMRKETYYKGKAVLLHHVGTLLDIEQANRLRAFCEKIRVTRGTVIREALDIYLGMAEQEYGEDNAYVPKPKVVKAPNGASVPPAQPRPAQSRPHTGWPKP